jgi:hypothetical protein
MKTRRDIERLAATHGFRPDTLEKVLLLLGILHRLDTHEAAVGAWVLKGGTALNLCHLPVPRLSVDVDLNFIGVEKLEQLAGARESFERVLVSCCEREGCAVRRAPSEHAGGKFRLRFPSAFGGAQNLEVDVNYVARVPLFAIERRRILVELDERGGVLPTLTLEELAAGKFAALMTRAAARDYFDAASLIEIAPHLPEDTRFRIALVCQAAGARQDLRTPTVDPTRLAPQAVANQLLPLLRVGDDRARLDATTLSRRLLDVLGTAAPRLVQWSPGERLFLDRLLDQGRIEPEHLTDDPALRERIARQPMLRWKQRHILRRLGTTEAEP